MSPKNGGPISFCFLFQRLLEHTEPDHPDYALLKRAETEIHELALKISNIQKELSDLELRQQVLR